MTFVPSYDILDRGTDQKILLFQPQLLSRISRIIRVQDTSDILSPLPGFKSIIVLGSIEGVEVKLIERQ